MKNWNKISQYIAASAGAALLASFATLATPKTASAATLSFDESINQWVSDNEAEAVDRIMNLEIGGKKYNVTFESKSYASLLEEQQQGIGSFGYTNSTDAASAAEAIMNVLGDSFSTNHLAFGPFVFIDDNFKVMESIISTELNTNSDRFVIDWYGDAKRDVQMDLLERSGVRQQMTRGAERTISELAVFEEAELGGGGGGVASTPEPSLIFGFITLGGLMLGSKIKNKS
ncbi:hypothetical protein [Dapis sp. BLCC M229]|uniref:hypothetical protein n=1 Tax=Dapis sp. BLCC M229 TaxID=3400188 RepID=UPI003CF0623B